MSKERHCTGSCICPARLCGLASCEVEIISDCLRVSGVASCGSQSYGDREPTFWIQPVIINIASSHG